MLSLMCRPSRRQQPHGRADAEPAGLAGTHPLPLLEGST